MDMLPLFITAINTKLGVVDYIFRVLQNNNITGPIPSELGKLSKLQTLDLSNNFFNGEIPPSLGHLRSLQYL